MGILYAFPKPKRIQHPELLKRVRNMPCTVCEAWPSEPHHITTVKTGGGDTGDNLIPLCRRHHDEWHVRGPGHMMRRYAVVFDWLERHERGDVIAKAQGGVYALDSDDDGDADAGDGAG